MGALVVNKATADSNKAMADSSNKVTARVNNKATARVNNKVTAAHHSNQQLQHLQVIHKVTANNNHTEQALEDHTDINKQGDLKYPCRQFFKLCCTHIYITLAANC